MHGLLDSPVREDGDQMLVEFDCTAHRSVRREGNALPSGNRTELGRFERPKPSMRATSPSEEPVERGPASGNGSLTSLKARESGKDAPNHDAMRAYRVEASKGKQLSREEEVALAKRIETAQRAVVTGLCNVPMLVEPRPGRGKQPLGNCASTILSICRRLSMPRLEPILNAMRERQSAR